MNKRTASNFVHGLNFIKVYLVEEPLSRLLARVLKEDVQFWYNETSTVKEGRGGEGFEEMFLWKTFEVYVSSCQYQLFQALFEIFQTNLLVFAAICFFT